MKTKKKTEVKDHTLHQAMLAKHKEDKYYIRKEHNDGIHKIKHPPNTLK